MSGRCPRAGGALSTCSTRRAALRTALTKARELPGGSVRGCPALRCAPLLTAAARLTLCSPLCGARPLRSRFHVGDFYVKWRPRPSPGFGCLWPNWKGSVSGRGGGWKEGTQSRVRPSLCLRLKTHAASVGFSELYIQVFIFPINRKGRGVMYRSSYVLYVNCDGPGFIPVCCPGCREHRRESHMGYSLRMPLGK